MKFGKFVDLFLKETAVVTIVENDIDEIFYGTIVELKEDFWCNYDDIAVADVEKIEGLNNDSIIVYIR